MLPIDQFVASLVIGAFSFLGIIAYLLLVFWNNEESATRRIVHGAIILVIMSGLEYLFYTKELKTLVVSYPTITVFAVTLYLTLRHLGSQRGISENGGNI